MSEEPQRKTALVDKPIPTTFDFGNLTVFDTNPLDKEQLQSDQKEEHIKSVTRDNVQLLVNQLLSLPVKRTTESHQSSSVQDSTVALFQLPDPVTPLPREKPIPKAKPPTKWEQFAAKKGIQKKAKDGKMVYDEHSGEWVPKWGYKGINKAKENEWIVEVDDKKQPAGADEVVDPRTLRRQERKALIKKNLRQQKKNALRVTK